MERTLNSPIAPGRFRRVSHPPVQTEVSYDRSALSRVWAALRANRLAMVCLVLMIIIIAASALAFLSPYDPDQYDLMNKLALPSLAHPFGTDDLGRDYFTRALYGGRVSLTVGFFSMLVSVALGTVVGTVSGYVGGAVDMLLMRFLDIIMSVPTFLLIIIINAYVKPGLPTMIFIIAIFSWMGVARIVRAETMSLKERDFGAGGQKPGHQPLCHHLPPHHPQHELLHHRGGQPVHRPGHSHRVLPQLPGVRRAPAQRLLGLHAPERPERDSL